MAKPELVTYDAFYMKELNDLINLKHDYDMWRVRQQIQVCVSRQKTSECFHFILG